MQHQQLLNYKGDAALMKRIINHIEDHLEQQLKIPELCMEFHISEREFYRLFEAYSPLSPYEYITLRRMKRARELLLHTNRSIADTALAVSYSDPSNFCKAYKAQFGVAPSIHRLEKKKKS